MVRLCPQSWATAVIQVTCDRPNAARLTHATHSKYLSGRAKPSKIQNPKSKIPHLPHLPRADTQVRPYATFPTFPTTSSPHHPTTPPPHHPTTHHPHSPLPHQYN
ncbi:hypothetical protein E1H13_21595 [Nodosilinea sp. P-1105]|nr:hypothetical protein [Nodosilinea sp. P-1105]